MWQLQDDGKLRAPSGNMIDLGKSPGDPVIIVGSTIVMPGALLLGTSATAIAIPGSSSAATNTTITIAGTTAGAMLFDTKANGSLGTVAYTFNDLVRALKVAGVIAQ